MPKLLWLPSVLLLAGCASVGTKVSEQQAQSFVVGKSTYSEVVATLGPPTSTVTNSTTQNRAVVYSYGAAQSKPQNFIPIIGPLIGGHNTQSAAAIFIFDKDGTLLRTTTSNGQGTTGINLAAE
jgi:hypothetical protein